MPALTDHPHLVRQEIATMVVLGQAEGKRLKYRDWSLGPG
jgi:hypothetical protein